VNDTLDTRRFQVNYDDVKSFNFHGELSYQFAEQFRLTFGADYHSYYELKNERKAWHLPTFKWTVASSYNFRKKLLVSAEVFSFNKTFAKLAGDLETKVKGTVDANLSATYFYSKNFSVFANVNNVAAVQHNRWYNYPTYGFQVIGGLAFSF
jgi:hypothetical protein